MAEMAEHVILLGHSSPIQSLGPRRIGTTFRQKQSSSATPHFSPLDVDLRHALPDGHLPKMGVSENSVPLNPMVNDHYPY